MSAARVAHANAVDAFGQTLFNTATRRAYLADLKTFATWVEAKYAEPFDVRGLLNSDVHQYKQHLIKLGRSPATINRSLIALSKFAQWCIAQGLRADDFTIGIKPVKVVKPGPQALSAIERDRLIRQAVKSENVRDIAVIITLAYTGLRVSELCALTRRDITLSERKGELRVRAGKGEKYRTVPLVHEVRVALTVYLGSRMDDLATLFLGQRGPLTDAGAYEIVRKYARLAKVKCHPHTLRHTFATHYLQKNPGDLVGLARLLGHDSLDTTARYTVPTLDDLAERMDA